MLIQRFKDLNSLPTRGILGQGSRLISSRVLVTCWLSLFCLLAGTGYSLP